MVNIKARTKAQKAMDLRMSGLRWDDVANALGYNSPQAACKAVHDLLKRTEQETAEQYRVSQVARLDTLLSHIWPGVMKGEIQAVLAALKIEDRRAKLLGLDAPTVLKGVGEGGIIEIEVIRKDKRETAMQE